MNRNAILSLLVLVFLTNTSAKAQEEARIYSIQYKPTETASFSETYRRCMSNSACTLQARLQLMDDLYIQMGESMRLIKKECSQSGYKDCINSQQKAVQEWHRAEQNMVDLMLVLEGKSRNLMAAETSDKN